MYGVEIVGIINSHNTIIVKCAHQPALYSKNSSRRVAQKAALDAKSLSALNDISQSQNQTSMMNQTVNAITNKQQ
jgi:hypothetical protein